MSDKSSGGRRRKPTNIFCAMMDSGIKGRAIPFNDNAPCLPIDYDFLSEDDKGFTVLRTDEVQERLAAEEEE